MKQLSFDEIMEHSAENRAIYDELLALMKESKGSGDYKVVPFVGAGMTAFAYPMWTAALTELAKELGETEDSIDGYFKNNNLEDVADILWNIAKKKQHRTETGRIITGTPIIGHILRNKIFKKEAILNEKLKQQAIYELACMFPNSLIITTNFDKALENAFSLNGKEIPCGFPGPNQEMLSQLASKNDQSYLFKMHGDIYGNTDDFVFPTTSYDQAYKYGSKLRGFLNRIFAEKSMLFLGASLNQDRYLALLKDSRNPKLINQQSHFAILECGSEPDKAKKRREELADYGIKAIFYPKGQYDAVHVILEQLFEDTDPIDFESFEPKFRNKQNLSKRFDFRNPFTEFVGREKELERLNDFLKGKNWNSDKPVSWWAVCGPGGMGKSRIARELSRNLLPGWKVCSFFDNRQLNFNDIQEKVNKYGSKVLIIVDYAQNISSDFANWIQSVNISGIGKEYRLLFLQREGYATDSSSQVDGLSQASSQMIPYWLQNIKNYYPNIMDLAYQKESLNLDPLSPAELEQLMISYADNIPDTEKEKELEPSDINKLIKSLQELDPGFMRSLYAMFLVDAHLRGSDPLSWDEEHILNHFSERELARIGSCFQPLAVKNGGFSKACWNTLRLLVVIATMNGGIYFSGQKENGLLERLKNLIQPNANLKDFLINLQGIGILGYDEIDDQYFMPAITPDLIGEATVLKYLQDIPPGQSELIENLENPINQNALTEFSLRFGTHYVDRISYNWVVKLKEIPFIWYSLLAGLSNMSINKEIQNGFSLANQLISNYPDDPLSTLMYATFLANCLPKSEKTRMEAEVCFENLRKKFPESEEIALAYAQGLVNLTARQENAKEINGTLKKFKSLLAVDKFPNSEKIAVEYAKGLLNLTARQASAIEIKETVEEIETLLAANRFFKSEEITLLFAQCSVNLSSKQESANERAETVQKIEALLKDARFLKSEQIALAYVQGLLNLTARQENEKEIKETVQKIESLLAADRFHKSKEISLGYAKGLANLTARQESANEIKVTVQKIESLLAADIFHKSEEISLAYANGLANLTVRQEGAKEIKETVQKIEVLLEKEGFPKSEGIALAYALGLFILTFSQESANEREKTIQKIESLLAADRFPKSEDISLAYAKGLFNLTFPQESVKYIIEIIQKIETLLAADRFPNSEGIALEYTKCLVNLTAVQESAKEIKETVQKIEGLLVADKFPESEEIAFRYSQGLFNLTSRQKSAKERKETVQKIEALLAIDRFPKSVGITLAYAQSLVNLTVIQESAKEIKETVQKLEALLVADKFPKSEEITLAYAQGLVNLTIIQESAKERKETVQKIEALLAIDRFPKSEGIALLYSQSLVSLTGIQESAKEREETVQKIEALLEEDRFLKSEEITLRYAQGLVNLTVVQKSAKAREETVQRIKSLLEEHRFPKSEEISLAYAKSLFNLTFIQESAKEIKETVQKIEALLAADKFPKSEGIILEYAKGLVNLMSKLVNCKIMEVAYGKFLTALQTPPTTKLEASFLSVVLFIVSYMSRKIGLREGN